MRPLADQKTALLASCAPLVLRRASSESAAFPINGNAQYIFYLSSRSFLFFYFFIFLFFKSGVSHPRGQESTGVLTKPRSTLKMERPTRASSRRTDENNKINNGHAAEATWPYIYSNTKYLMHKNYPPINTRGNLLIFSVLFMILQIFIMQG